MLSTFTYLAVYVIALNPAQPILIGGTTAKRIQA